MISLFLLGVVASVVGSLIGLGGGFVIVPVLTMLFHFEMKDAIFFSLASILFLSAIWNFKNRENLKTHRRMIMDFGWITIAGAAGAAYLGLQLPSVYLQKSFAILLIAFSVYYFFDSREPGALKALHPTWLARILFLSAGTLGGLLGIGGGIINVPTLNRVLGFPMKEAARLSFAFVFLSSGFALLVYLRLRRDAIEALNPLFLFALLAGTFVGAMLAQRLKPSHQTVRRLFCLVMLIVGIAKLFAV